MNRAWIRRTTGLLTCLKIINLMQAYISALLELDQKRRPVLNHLFPDGRISMLAFQSLDQTFFIGNVSDFSVVKWKSDCTKWFFLMKPFSSTDVPNWSWLCSQFSFLRRSNKWPKSAYARFMMINPISHEFIIICIHIVWIFPRTVTQTQAYACRM